MKKSRPSRTSRASALLPPAALLVAVLVVFHPVRDFQFTKYDEQTQLIDNLRIRSLSPANIARIFSGRSITNYYPVRLLSFAVDYRLWGLDPAGYHTTNLVLHAASTLLLYWLILRLAALARRGSGRSVGRPSRRRARDGPPPAGLAGGPAVRIPAALAAGLFALHPVVVESVAWVAGREELLMLLFVLACMHFYVSALGGQSWRRFGFYALAVAAGACACMSNVVGAIVPFLLLALCLTVAGPWPPRRTWKRVAAAALSTWPFWVLAIATLAIRQMGPDTSRVGMRFTMPVLSPAERAAVVSRAYPLNLKTLIWPDELILIYPEPARTPAPDALLVVGVIVAAGTVAAVWALRRNRLALFGALWFLLALGPSSQLLPHHIMRADRFLYLPLGGLVMAAFAGLQWLLRRRARAAWLIAPAAAAIVCAAGVRSWRQLPVWRNTLTVFQHCLKGNPASTDAHTHVGNWFGEHGDRRRAVQHYKAAIDAKPGYPHAWYNWGRLLAKLGRHDLAREKYETALRCAPTHLLARVNLGNSLVRLGKPDRAIPQYRRALQIAPTCFEAHFNWGLALQVMGRDDEAADRFREALTLARAKRQAGLVAAVEARLAALARRRRGSARPPDDGSRVPGK